MRISAVDIGSNTIKMKIFDVKGERLELLHTVSRPTKLISFIENGILSLSGIDALCKTLVELKEISDEKQADMLRCFATASLRRTENINDILTSTPIPIELISGTEEAELSFLGTMKSLEKPLSGGIFADMGGGSTELVSFDGMKIKNEVSLNFGCLSLYLDFSEEKITKQSEFEKIREYAKNKVNEHKSLFGEVSDGVFVGGTVHAVDKLYHNYFQSEENCDMKADRLKELYALFCTVTPEISDLLERLVPERVYTVLPGLAAYVGICEALGIKRITVSTAGIREGFVYKKILGICE